MDGHKLQRLISRQAGSLDACVSDLIRRAQDRYALDFDPRPPQRRNQAQLELPFQGASCYLSPHHFPLSPVELLRAIFPEGIVSAMDGARRDRPEALASSELATNPRGEVFVRVRISREHIDGADEPTGLGRFGAFRETCRAVALLKCIRAGTPELGCLGWTREIMGGEFLRSDFYADDLSRWAMRLGCPPAELQRLLTKRWGRVPVTPAMIGDLPKGATNPLAYEQVFAGARYDGRRLPDMFGLGANALVGWCNYLRYLQI